MEGAIINPFCNTEIVQKIINGLPNKTSSGLDDIPPIILKHLPDKVLKDYTVLFNNALNWHYFPKD